MLDPALLALLVCPATHQEVFAATASDCQQMRDALSRGELQTVGGKLAPRSIDGALIRADRAVAYPVIEGIPVMLIPEALLLPPHFFSPEIAPAAA